MLLIRVTLNRAVESCYFFMSSMIIAERWRPLIQCFNWALTFQSEREQISWFDAVIINTMIRINQLIFYKSDTIREIRCENEFILCIVVIIRKLEGIFIIWKIIFLI